MFKGNKMMFGILSGLMIVTGCSSVSSTTSEENTEEILEQNQKEILFENSDAGIKIYESSNWTLEQEIYAQNLNATFHYETLKAIVSVIPSEKTMEQIKKELRLGDGLITVLEENDDYFSFHTNQIESIRSDLFIEYHEGKTLIITFVSSLEDFENYHKEIEQFKENIILTNQD